MNVIRFVVLLAKQILANEWINETDRSDKSDYVNNVNVNNNVNNDANTKYYSCDGCDHICTNANCDHVCEDYTKIRRN